MRAARGVCAASRSTSASSGTDDRSKEEVQGSPDRGPFFCQVEVRDAALD